MDPSRLGMIGFSAGAGLTMHSTLNSKTMKLAFIAPSTAAWARSRYRRMRPDVHRHRDG